MLLGIPSRFLDEIPPEHLELVSRVERHRSYGVQKQTYGRMRTHDEGGSRYEYDEQRPSRRTEERFPIPEVDFAPAPARPSTAFTRARPQFTRSSPTSAMARNRASPAFTGVRGGGSSAPETSRESYVDRSDVDGSGGDELSSGTRVRHAKYGEGEVLSVEPGRPPKVTVKFAGWGVKQILATYLEPG
jgi:hypothetical protein